MTATPTDPSPSLVSQAQTILEAETSLQHQLVEASLLQASFSATGRRDWHDASHLPSVLEMRPELLDSVHSMFSLFTGPLDMLL